MELTLKRNIYGAEETIGNLSVNGAFQCYTLEDQKRDTKVYGDTCIPEGRYEIKLRTFGRMHERYTVKFPKMHHGMLWLQEVPNYDGILIHIGNFDTDTRGCILVGRTYSEIPDHPGRYEIQNSTAEYMLLYPKVCQALMNKERVFITIS